MQKKGVKCYVKFLFATTTVFPKLANFQTTLNWLLCSKKGEREKETQGDKSQVQTNVDIPRPNSNSNEINIQKKGIIFNCRIAVKDMVDLYMQIKTWEYYHEKENSKS